MHLMRRVESDLLHVLVRMGFGRISVPVIIGAEILWFFNGPSHKCVIYSNIFIFCGKIIIINCKYK
jgi:hypothetical protein